MKSDLYGRGSFLRVPLDHLLQDCNGVGAGWRDEGGKGRGYHPGKLDAHGGGQTHPLRPRFLQERERQPDQERRETQINWLKQKRKKKELAERGRDTEREEEEEKDQVLIKSTIPRKCYSCLMNYEHF